MDILLKDSVQWVLSFAYSKTPIADISKTLGHSRISTTVDMYVKNYDNYYKSTRDNINKIK